MAEKPPMSPRGAVRDGREGRLAKIENADDPVDVVSGGALAVLSRTEIDIQIATAKRWPRIVSKFRADAIALATMDQETAESMGFALPRGGKPIVGPSVRLAEIVGSTWGNLRYGARIVEIGQERLVAQGACHDLEANNAVTVEVTRRITYKGGERFNEDMIAVTAQAAMSIALRNAIFRIVPMAYVNTIYRAAMEVAVGKGQPMALRRERALSWITQHMGGTQDQMLLVLGRRGLDDVTLDDLELLQGYKSAIKDGDATWEQIVVDARARVEPAPTPAPAAPDPQPEAAASDGHGDEARDADIHAGTPALHTVEDPGSAPRAPVAPPPTARERELPREPEFADCVQRCYDAIVDAYHERGADLPANVEAQAEERALEEWATAVCVERRKLQARLGRDEPARGARKR